VGLNGANRLGSNSLPECLVFGAVAGRAAARFATEAKPVTANPIDSLVADERSRLHDTYLNRNGTGDRIGEIREAMQNSMDRVVAVFRTGEGLQEMADELPGLRERLGRARLDDRSQTFNTELVSALELEYLLDSAETIVHSAIAREESRGAHARTDFPNRDDERYLAHTLAYRQPEGPPRLEYRPVTITQWQPQVRSY
jgi:fumarate reductase flavoprotein subunit